MLAAWRPPAGAQACGKLFADGVSNGLARSSSRDLAADAGRVGRPVTQGVLAGQHAGRLARLVGPCRRRSIVPAVTITEQSDCWDEYGAIMSSFPVVNLAGGSPNPPLHSEAAPSADTSTAHPG